MSEERSKRSIAAQIGKYAAMFAVFAILFYVIPYCDDDLRWGGPIGLERLAKWFEGYGGRYIGYLIIILLTRFYAAKVLFQAAVMTYLVYQLEQLGGGRKTEFITILFLFFMPLSMFADSIGWTAGFANYITSITFTLIYVRYVYKRLDGEKVTASFVAMFAFALLGFVNSLIVEHFTIYNFCLAVFMILYTLFSDKRIRLPEIGYLAGVIGGIVLMLTNSTYRNVASGDDFYRGIEISDLLPMLPDRINRVLNIMYLQLPIIVIAVTIVMILVWKERRGHLSRAAGTVIDIGMVVICTVNPLLLLANEAHDYKKPTEDPVSFVLCVTVLIAIILTSAIFSFNAGKFWQCMGALISVVVPAAPFIIISPLSYRCLTGSYVFWIIFIYRLLELIPETRDRILSNRYLRRYLVLAAYAAIFFYICIYARIAWQDRIRLGYIRSEAEKGAAEVTVGHLSNENFCNDITLRTDSEWKGYRDFYGIDEDIRIKVSNKVDFKGQPIEK